MFVAADRQIPRIMIESRQGELLQTKKIIVSIDAWPRNSRYPLVSTHSYVYRTKHFMNYFVTNFGHISQLTYYSICRF